MKTMLFLDNVEPPAAASVEAPFDLLVTGLFLKLAAVNNDNKAPFATVTDKKTNVIETFVATWRTHIGNDIYPAVRLIFPNRDGRKYYIKDVALTRLVTKLLELTPQLADYRTIREWKKAYQQKKVMAGKSEIRNLGDLPLIVARMFLRRRGPETVKSSVSVNDVNATLDALTRTLKTQDQLELLRPFLDKLTIEEIKCFLQMVLKESMLSFFERAFFVAWHPDAYELFKVCNDMKKIFWSLPDPEIRLLPSQLCVQPMYQFVPQSSQKLTLSYEKLCRKMAADLSPEGKDTKLVDLYHRHGYHGHFLIEEKIDGDRMLMHMTNGAFLWHTRRRRDYTSVYGENVHLGSLTKHLVGAFHEKVSSIVLDGEMVAWSKDRQCLLPFGTLRSAAIQEALKQFDVIDVYEGNNSWPFFLIFDILHLNGQDLSQLPLFYRKELLRQTVREVPHRFELLLWVKARNPADIKANMQRIISDRNEGIMVKSLLLKYRVYSRENTWIKVKPEYLENFGENLDLVVIGKIGRVKTSYICGLKDMEDGGCYRSFCMVANGFSHAVYKQIESRLGSYWRDYNVQRPPNDLLKFGTRKPHYWIDPANLIVLEIKARSIEVAAETAYAAGSTLHNLWCRAVRDDKSYDECITLQDYQEIRAAYSTNVHMDQAVNRDRKNLGGNSVVERYDGRSRMESPGMAQKKLDLFSLLVFVVGTDFKDGESGEHMNSEKLVELIRQHGGAVSFNPQQACLQGQNVVVVGSRLTPRLTRWMDQGFDILLPRWVVESIRHKALLPLEPQFITGTGNHKLSALAKSRLDEFGDSFLLSTAKTLRHLRHVGVPAHLTEESLARNRDIDDISSLATLFSKLTFYVHSKDSWERKRVERRVVRFGGHVSVTVEGCHYVLMAFSTQIEDMKAGLRHHVVLGEARVVGQLLSEKYVEGGVLPVLVAEDFILACVSEGDLVDDGPYRL